MTQKKYHKLNDGIEFKTKQKNQPNKKPYFAKEILKRDFFSW